MLRFLTAGESHGKALLGILEGMPAGLKVDMHFINKELRRRQGGYGRGGRMKIENDTVEILSGLKNAATIASPIGFVIKNKDARLDTMEGVFCPRPGHGDLAGGLKYGFDDLRCVLERASARETAMRVAVGAICKQLLKEFKISITSSVLSVGGQTQQERIKHIIDQAKQDNDTLGGIFKVVASGVPVGLGSYVQYDRRLDGRLAMAVMSVPAIKAVGIGLGVHCADKYGSQVHDAIYYTKQKGYYRLTNNAGGIEAGVSNGEDVVVCGYMKPIATLGRPLDSVDIRNKKAHKAAVERYDTCAVESAGVVGEAMVAFEIAKAFLEKFGCDSLKEITRNYRAFQRQL